jgi:hypothetical protein
MTHPDLGRLTSWVHGFLEPGDASGTEDHVAACPECRRAVEGLREEARVLSRELAPSKRLAAIQEGLFRTAQGRRPSRGLLWQAAVAAALLIGLIAVLLSPGSRHRLVEGRVALEDGRVVEAPTDLAASQPWQLRAVAKASVRLSDRSTVDLGPGARLSLRPGGERGVQPGLASGEARFVVSPDARRLSVISPAGRVEAADGKFEIKIVSENEGGDSMKTALAGAIITVFAGSVSLANAEGSLEAQTGQSAVLARAEAPLFLAAPQDKQEELLRRLEQLAARVQKLEDEVAQLDQKNKQLKQQLQVNGLGGPGGAWSVQPGQSGGVRVLQANPGAAPGSVIIIQEEDEKKVERKNATPKER